MRTAEEMNMFIKDNQLGSGMTEKWNLKHLKVIEEQLNPDENVLISFIGLHNYESSTKHNSNYAYAITDSRFIMGQKKMIGENVQTILRKNLNDVTKRTGAIFGVITFSTLKEDFNIGVDSSTINRIYDLVNNTLFSDNDTDPKEDHVAQLTQLKELFDLGVLTEQEFNDKKRLILEKM